VSDAITYEEVKWWYGRSLERAVLARLPKPDTAERDELVVDAERWRAMRKSLVAADFAPEMGGWPVVIFECHAERVGFGPEGADAIADAAIRAYLVGGGK